LPQAAHATTIAAMNQADLGLNLSTKRTFLDEMERVVLWTALIALIEPHWPKGKSGRPPFAPDDAQPRVRSDRPQVSLAGTFLATLVGGCSTRTLNGALTA